MAELYGIETKRLNQQANRNVKRFPPSFRFQLSVEEKDELVAKCNRFDTMKHSSSLPYVFTEQWVAMLSAVLHTPKAVDISVKIMDAFVAMRRFLASNAQVFQRLDFFCNHPFVFAIGESTSGTILFEGVYSGV